MLFDFSTALAFHPLPSLGQILCIFVVVAWV
jgi:hypothetical protein